LEDGQHITAKEETMSLWVLLSIVCAAGAVGGIANALLTDNGFILPHPEETESSAIIRPGFLGNIFVGAIAAGISWGLYGPFAAALIIGSQPGATASTEAFGLSLSALVGALLVGVAGAKWLTNEVDKRLLRAAASRAAASNPLPDASRRIAVSSPAEALRIARSL
jgi:hypothetical protein